MRKVIYDRNNIHYFGRVLDFVHIYNLKTNFVSYDNLIKGEKYAYIKYSQNHPFIILETDHTDIDEIIFKKVNEGFDIKIMYVCDNEAGVDTSLDIFENFLGKFKFDLEKVYLINNIKKDYHKINVDSLQRIVWEGSKCLIKYQSTFNLDDKKKLFQCYNRATNAYRTSVIVDLIKENLIDEVDWSHLRRPDYLNSFHNGMQKYEIITGNKFETIESIYNHLVDICPKRSEFELDYDIEPGGIIDYNIYYDKNPYKHSYINIVNESKFDEFDGNMIHVTEKTLLPFYFYQLPIFFASHNHVKFLENEYGLDMFRDFINHSYDDEKNSALRYHKIFKEIKRLYKNKSDVIEFYKSSEERFIKNKMIIESFTEELKKQDTEKLIRIIQS
jgi:hypothetical protein